MSTLGTGRHLVLMHPGGAEDAISQLRNRAGIRIGSDADVSGPLTAANAFRGTHGYMLSDVDCAVTEADPDQTRAMIDTARDYGPVAWVEPERTVHPHPVLEEDGAGEGVEPQPDLSSSWGVMAVGASSSQADGRGTRIAILDTGVDLDHPDLASKQGQANSFVHDENSSDVTGHGTHVAGVATGPRELAAHPGYGVAPGAELYAGKVIDRAGNGSDGAVLSGIAWAVRHKCRVVCMSLGAPVHPGDPYSRVFEQVCRRALEKGTLVLAAAGNGAKRDQDLAAPVAHPANCPSVMAIGAVEQGGQLAAFSNASVDMGGGAVDLVAPGVDVFSAWLGGYRQLSGTSMAAPHVAGVASLISQATGAKGWELWARLSAMAARLPLPSRDVGAGLVQAP